MKITTPVIYMFALALSFAGCATQESAADKELTVKAKKEQPADSPEAIAQRAAETFANAPGLTNEQKQKLVQIYSNTYFDSIRIRGEIGQNKSLLFKTVVSKDYNSTDVQKLKAKVTKLDQERLALMFKALEDVQKVVGYGKQQEQIYRHFHDYEMPRALEY